MNKVRQLYTLKHFEYGFMNILTELDSVVFIT